MAKIVFGVCGVGAGHYIRSKVIIEHLSKKNDLIIIAGLNSYEKFKKHYKNVYLVDGLEFGLRENKIVTLTTIIKNLKKISIKNYLNIKRLKNKLDDFKPNIIISDWELFTNLYARDKKLNLISIDNEHFILYGLINFEKKYRLDYYKTYLFSKLFNYGKAIIIGLPGQKLRQENMYIVNPILRKEIVKLKIKNDGHILVYPSIVKNEKLIELLKNIKARFILYNYNYNNKIEGNIIFKKFDEKEFLKDLASSRGIITTGGFTLISEATYLKKPLLVMPIKNHFEQILNAQYVKENNLGMIMEEPNSRTIEIFLLNLERFGTKKYEPGNKKLFRLLDEMIKCQN